MSISIKQFFYWGAGAIAVIALASAEPDLATILVLIIIVGVLLTHWKDYAGLLSIPYATKK